MGGRVSWWEIGEVPMDLGIPEAVVPVLKRYFAPVAGAERVRPLAFGRIVASFATVEALPAIRASFVSVGDPVLVAIPTVMLVSHPLVTRSPLFLHITRLAS